MRGRAGDGRIGEGRDGERRVAGSSPPKLKLAPRTIFLAPTLMMTIL